MVYEMRVYTVQPGKVGELQTLFEKEGLPVIKEYSKLVGWWSTEIGPLNQVIHLWAYNDHGHREQVRAAQNAEPRLAAYRIDEFLIDIGTPQSYELGQALWPGL